MKHSQTFAWSLVLVVAGITACHAGRDGFHHLVDDPRARLLGVVPFRVPAESMEPTLKYNSIVLVCTSAYKEKTPAVGDVIIVPFPPYPADVVERIIAIGPATLAIQRGVVLVDGQEIPEPYLRERQPKSAYSREFPETQVAAGKMFLMGDNRDNSLDSRKWGSLRVDSAEGRICTGVGK